MTSALFIYRTTLASHLGNFNEDLLHHMSPLGWKHINLLGEYHFNSEKMVSLDSLRPLKLS
jgi:hypothetical protein